MILMMPPPLDQEDDEMLVPHSDLASNDPQPMEEAANVVDTHLVDDLPSARFTWTIEHFTRLNTKKLYSEIFLVGGYKWRVLMFPKGNNVKHLSMYLDVADSATLPHGWSRHAQFSLSVINHFSDKFTVRKDTQHKFSAGASDWGFTSLLPLVELNDPVRGFLVNNTVVLEVDLAILNSHDSRKETGFEPKIEKGKKETGDNASGNVEADIAGTTSPESTQSDATATAGKVRFLSYWVSSEALLLLEKIHRLHEGTYVKFSMKGQALPTVLLESFAAFIASMSSTKVNELNEEALRLAANSIEDFEQVGLDLRWLKQRLEEAKGVKKHSDSVNTVESCTSALEVARATVDSCTSALEVARAKVRELEDGLAKAKLEGEVTSRELPKSLGVNDSVLKDIV